MLNSPPGGSVRMVAMLTDMEIVNARKKVAAITARTVPVEDQHEALNTVLEALGLKDYETHTKVKRRPDNRIDYGAMQRDEK